MKHKYQILKDGHGKFVVKLKRPLRRWHFVKTIDWDMGKERIQRFSSYNEAHKQIKEDIEFWKTCQKHIEHEKHNIKLDNQFTLVDRMEWNEKRHKED